MRHHFARQYDKAVEHFQGVLEREPSSKLASYCLWFSLEQLGDYSQALVELRRLTRGVAASQAEDDRPGTLTRQSYAAALREELSQLVVLRDRRILSAGDVAAIYTFLGETDVAFDWLEKAYDARDSRLPWAKLDPRYDPLRADARFEALLRRMNLHS